MTEKFVQLKSNVVTVNIASDHYGNEFWERISTRQYEPDTIGFIENRCDSETIFFDIGAANGAMMLIAASEGATVYAYEPEYKIFSVAHNNALLNNHLPGTISIMNCALSTVDGTLNFRLGSNSKVLSDIVFTGIDSKNPSEIQVLSLANEIENNHADLNKRLVVKMDIEGAEWLILSDEKILQTLNKHCAEILLAVHPGFYRAYSPTKIKGLDSIRVAIWHLRNYFESRRLFTVLAKYAVVRRTNLNEVKSANQFGLLIFAGYHEWILEFGDVRMELKTRK